MLQEHKRPTTTRSAQGARFNPFSPGSTVLQEHSCRQRMTAPYGVDANPNQSHPPSGGSVVSRVHSFRQRKFGSGTTPLASPFGRVGNVTSALLPSVGSAAPRHCPRVYPRHCPRHCPRHRVISPPPSQPPDVWAHRVCTHSATARAYHGRAGYMWPPPPCARLLSFI